MREDLASDVRLWDFMVRHFGTYDDDEELIAAFIRRDEIHDQLKAGATLSDELRSLLRAADDAAVRQARSLANRFQDTFWRGRHLGREHWWWYLDEGPQVREEAEKAA